MVTPSLFKHISSAEMVLQDARMVNADESEDTQAIEPRELIAEEEETVAIVIEIIIKPMKM